MSKDKAGSHWPLFFTMIAALALHLLPLPDAVEAFRPDWVALVLVFWCMQLPLSYGIGLAWICGIVLDVAHGTLLGQHALALTLISYLTLRLHLQMRVFPLLQLTATVFAIIALYQFLLFWINGVAGVNAPAISYWAPVISSAIVWPPLYSYLSGLRFRSRSN